MVRLVVSVTLLIINEYDKFQFHCGTIGSSELTSLQRMELLFQFHYGTIGSPAQQTKQHSQIKFQFHYGTIGRFKDWSDAEREYNVSIPLWYDW